MLTNEGPAITWILETAPDCGGVYLMTSDMISNGGNPCDDDENCNDPVAAGTNLTELMSLDAPYLVYLWNAYDDDECDFSSTDTLIFQEYSIPEFITITVSLVQNENNAPIAYGQSIQQNGGTSQSFTLEGSIDSSDTPDFAVTIFDFDTSIGTLLDAWGNAVVNARSYNTSDFEFTPAANTFSTNEQPIGGFNFVMTGDSGLLSEPADVYFFVEYTGTNPIVPDRNINMETETDNVYTPEEVQTNAAKPTEFYLETLPPLASIEVYQSSDGFRVGPQITTVPTRIHDDLIFYVISNVPTSGTFEVSATNADGDVSPNGVMSYNTLNPSSFPQLVRCIVNVAIRSSTVINLANDNCVDPTSSVPMEDLTFFVMEAPQQGELFQWVDGGAGDRILSTDTRVNVGNGEILFVITENVTTPQYAQLRYTASETSDINGNLASEWLVINVVENTPPFVQASSVDETTDEDIPITLTLTGDDFERTLLQAKINTLPPRGTLHQYDGSNTADFFKGDPIVANENDIFTITDVTDAQNRVVFSPLLNEFGSPYTTFTYFVSDGLDDSNLGIASLTVDPVPDPPISSDSFYTVEEVSKTIIQLEGFDPESDDNDRIQFELLSIPIASENAAWSGQLFQTNGFETYDPDEPILFASESEPVAVEDALGRLVYVAADVPVQFAANNSRFIVQVDFNFRTVVPEMGTTAEQISNIATVTVDILGVNNPPFTQSQSVTTLEDTPVSITLQGSDMDMEDEPDLIVYISEVPKLGLLSQWVDLTQTQQFEIIQTSGISVSDPERRVIYIPDENQVGDPLDAFSFVYFDGKETSFSSEVEITVLCVNDAPTLGELPENVKAEDGTDIVIFLGGADVDSSDPLGYCFGDMANFEAVIAIIPNNETNDLSTLYQYIDPDDQGLTDPDRIDDLDRRRAARQEEDPLATYQDGTIPIKQTRGPIIDQNNTVVTDPYRRVIFAAKFNPIVGEANSSVSQFSYFFQDAESRSAQTDLDIEVRVFSGVDPDSYGETWRAIIAYLAGVGLAALILLCVCIILSLMARKPQIEENDEGWIEIVPDREEDGYEVEMEEDDDDVIEKPKSPLEELLLQENAKVVTTLCEIIEVTEFDEVAGALVAIFEFHNQTLELIKKLISKEVHEASSAGTLFRSNSMASKVMTAYSKKIGQEYLEATLITPISHILDKDFSFEIDPRKLGPGEDRKQNMKLLLKACENFFDWITTSGNNAPPQFKTICYHLYREVESKFPQNRHSAVGGFLFLRFFCPAIISPDGHGIKPETSISVRSRRCFVLVAKALQNLSNGLLFGQKENYMMELNNFIEGHKADIIAFFEDMSRDEMVGKGRAAVIDTMELEEALNTAHRHLYLNMEEMQEVLAQRGGGTEGTIQSEIASKMTDGLTTFLHTQSHLDTSDISGLTAGGRPRLKSRAGTVKSGAGESWLDWVQDSDKTLTHDFTFEGAGSDLDGSSLVETENIEVVPFAFGGGDKDEITDFDLSSHVPDSSESGMDDQTSFTHTHTHATDGGSSTQSHRSRRGRRHHRRLSHRRMSRGRMSAMSHNTMSAMSSYKGAGTQSHGLMTDGGFEYGDDEFGEIDEVDDMGEGGHRGGDEGQRMAEELMKVLDDLGPPPGL
eukprot:CAMPEP_0201514696 /NCGR_PEP_ID=MMETSP0161_2-20130828/6463_1 /ASSEMBLY_ACC=CAM_ASM_000251 /TAXON_ID=180227 /ORGANISM="Neoparamoeba aestuarina, Strain SoJaBio B1-5/56/2" /LENGTH=1626 /DNA_ID=CAMNT_0047911325 /DNA_START=239 /DNA_END=5119 /DNA_ORIENTATION=-